MSARPETRVAKRWMQISVRPIPDEWIMGLVSRLHRLAEPVRRSPFYKEGFDITELTSTAHTVRKVAASGAWGAPHVVAEKYTFQNYFAQFIGGTGVGRFPPLDADMMTTGRCFWEADPMPLRLGMRSCPACGDEQLSAHGFRTLLRSHNLPGVTACWKHGLELCSQSDCPYSFGLPAEVGREHWRYASLTEVWMARMSRNALVAPTTGAHYLADVRHAVSEMQGDKMAAAVTKELLASFPASFMHLQKLDAQSLERSLRLMTRGHKHRSIGCTRILLLASSLRYGARKGRQNAPLCDLSNFRHCPVASRPLAFRRSG